MFNLLAAGNDDVVARYPQVPHLALGAGRLLRGGGIKRGLFDLHRPRQELKREKEEVRKEGGKDGKNESRHKKKKD